MRKYDAFILSKKEIENDLHTSFDFTSDGFPDESSDKLGKVDWLNIIERKIGQPIISIRPGGRPASWDEILVICAKGSVDSETSIKTLDYQTEEELKTVLLDIFFESDVDEIEAFEWYKATCPDDVWTEVCKWVYRTF